MNIIGLVFGGIAILLSIEILIGILHELRPGGNVKYGVCCLADCIGGIPGSFQIAESPGFVVD
jgi:hypothetical protein